MQEHLGHNPKQDNNRNEEEQEQEQEMVDWIQLLGQLRTALQQGNDSKQPQEGTTTATASTKEEVEFLLVEVQSKFPLLKCALETYCQLLDCAAATGSTNDEFAGQKDNTGATISAQDKKKIILNTRAALRIALICSSYESNSDRDGGDDSGGCSRDEMVQQAVVECIWHIQLFHILSHPRRGDSKCRLFASQLLSNLVTSHSQASLAITSALPLSPSQDMVDQQIGQGLAHLGINNNDTSRNKATKIDNESITEPYTVSTTNNKWNWVDLILSCAHSNDRPAFAGIVAALHNSIISLQLPPQQEQPESSETTQTGVPTFAKKMASDSLLVSTLLRQMISLLPQKNSNTQQQKQQRNGASPVNGGQESIQKPSNRIGNEDSSLADATTEWIVLLLTKLCKLGLLPTLFVSASGGGENGRAWDKIVIVPEHVVLLESIRSELDVQSAPRTISRDNMTQKQQQQQQHNYLLMGGEAGEQGVISTHVFLAKIVGVLRNRVPLEHPTVPEATIQTDPDVCLNHSALVTILEILSCSLGMDDPAIALARTALGQEEKGDTTLLSDSGRDLGALVDSITTRNLGRKNRDFFMSEEEKQVTTALVQLIGNLCFRCRQNQDLVRTTMVPTTTTKTVDVISSSAGDSANDEEERNALHVILSCTSLAHSCFLLREWSIIAIRNLLDQNELNQAVVAKLEANQPVQSAELSGLGIRVDMDSKGKVSVVPADNK